MDMATIMDQNFLDLLDRINHLESIPASTPIAACGEASPNSQLIFQNEPFRIHLSDQMSHNHSESVHYSGISKTGRCHFVLSPEGNIRLAFVTANSGYALRPGRAVHQQSGRTRRPHDEGSSRKSPAVSAATLRQPISPSSAHSYRPRKSRAGTSSKP